MNDERQKLVHFSFKLVLCHNNLQNKPQSTQRAQRGIKKFSINIDIIFIFKDNKLSVKRQEEGISQVIDFFNNFAKKTKKIFVYADTHKY